MMLPRFGMTSGGLWMGGGFRDDSLVATACSGMASAMDTSLSLSSFSWLTTFLNSVRAAPSESSPTLKLSRRWDGRLLMPTPLVDPSSFVAGWGGTTDTKDALTLEVGRAGLSSAPVPAGDRPRGSGEEAFWLSNIARRLRTPAFVRSVMAATGQTIVSESARGVVLRLCITEREVQGNVVDAGNGDQDQLKRVAAGCRNLFTRKTNAGFQG